MPRFANGPSGQHASPRYRGVLQTLAPDATPVWAMIELTVIPASRRHVRAAQRAVERLTTRRLFRTRRTIARWYANAASSPSIIARTAASLFAMLFARQRIEQLSDDELTRTSSRLHDNEKDLQAAAVICFQILHDHLT